MDLAGNKNKANNSGEDADLTNRQEAELKEGLDYYVENGLLVFTASFLQKRGYCCESGCRHCPYGYALHKK